MSDCWRRSGTTSGAMHTAMPRTTVVLSSVYIITTSGFEYKDGVVGISPFLLAFWDNLTHGDSACPCPYHVHATLYCHGMNRRHDVSVICFNISDIPSRALWNWNPCAVPCLVNVNSPCSLSVKLWSCYTWWEWGENESYDEFLCWTIQAPLGAETSSILSRRSKGADSDWVGRITRLWRSRLRMREIVSQIWNECSGSQFIR